MTCREAYAAINTELDGAGSAADLDALDEHAAICANCAMKRRRLGAVVRALRSAETRPEGATDPLRRSVRDAVRAVAAARRRQRRKRALPTAAALVLGVGIGWFVRSASERLVFVGRAEAESVASATHVDEGLLAALDHPERWMRVEGEVRRLHARVCGSAGESMASLTDMLRTLKGAATAGPSTRRPGTPDVAAELTGILRASNPATSR